ncbi:hypothetical protein [Pseudalkalibacillus berkeleyi]|uniref:Uncharacterized protein n=1 Tax=Pseudalkalibacillus berkeleyi TaxID=1069813 RepID=A0ABS9GY69_9BACL|nr:hypothetical protein [Pseudalkalibacillus berkeleyi]MCF6137698.1 hypothetical protein [Pseudalkalibacillus berkeleyi]
MHKKQNHGCRIVSSTKQAYVNQKFFRPSCNQALNVRFNYSFFDPYYKKEPTEIVLPQYLMATPDDAIINYFSVLREAAQFSGEKSGGCGTIGEATVPYPIAYNFHTKNYKKRIDFKTYYDSFQNIGHINLIKVRQTPSPPENTDQIRYFVELETIEGSDKGITYFGYYYGFILLKKENDRFMIFDFTLEGEDFLCAPYHGWNHDAEAIVGVKYGNWCKLVSKRYPMHQQGYLKQVCFDGTDGYRYLIVFIEITNGYDIEIAQYRINENGSWEPIFFDPLDCVNKIKG